MQFRSQSCIWRHTEQGRRKGSPKALYLPVKFIRTDVTKYEDLIALFDTALKAFGKVDCAISNAGVVEIGN